MQCCKWLRASALSLENPFKQQHIMQATSKIQVAVIPFSKGNETATIVTDGKAIRAYTQDGCNSFCSLWWAVEALVSNGFHFDYDGMQPFADEAFNVIAAPAGWSTRRIGVHWYASLGGIVKAFGETKWRCQVEAIRETLKYAS